MTFSGVRYPLLPANDLCPLVRDLNSFGSAHRETQKPLPVLLTECSLALLLDFRSWLESVSVSMKWWGRAGPLMRVAGEEVAIYAEFINETVPRSSFRVAVGVCRRESLDIPQLTRNLQQGEFRWDWTVLSCVNTVTS